MRPKINRPKARCRAPGCSRDALGPKQICASCQAAATKLVQAGLCTWSDLEKTGLIATAKPSHNPMKAAILDAVEKGKIKPTKPVAIKFRKRA